MKEHKPAHIMKATRILQAKIGRGQIKEEDVQKSQGIIDQNGVDFIPLAEPEIKKLKEALAEGRKNGPQTLEKDRLVKPVMQLKANAGMFKFQLISDITGVLLDFLEILTAYDEDVLDIVEANIQTVDAILVERLTGSGGKSGQEIIHEITAACRRYVNKYKGTDKLNIPDNSKLPFLSAG